MQRTRLLAAAVSAVDELGYADVTVGQITARARISRRTFYELFENRESCLAAVVEDALQRVHSEIAARGLDRMRWRERVRNGLWVVLSFFDREPALARVCIVQSSRGNERLLERRADLLAGLAQTIDEGRSDSTRGIDPPPLTAEGVVGAAHAIVYERVLRRTGEPLTGLFTALMSMIVLPYLGPAAARREQVHPSPPPMSVSDEMSDMPTAGCDPLLGVPIRLTYRTIRVLHVVSGNPGISNKAVGGEAGVTDQGQISKLLARLERVGLLVNTGEGQVRGEPNAWRLTPKGEQITHNISSHTDVHMQVA